MNEFYGATAEAIGAVNSRLGIQATGREQDWEVEFADPPRIAEMLDLAEQGMLDLEARSALWLLILASFDVIFENGGANSELVARAGLLISRDPDVLFRMRFHWLGLGRGNSRGDIEVILSVCASSDAGS